MASREFWIVVAHRGNGAVEFPCKDPEGHVFTFPTREEAQAEADYCNEHFLAEFEEADHEIDYGEFAAREVGRHYTVEKLGGC